MLDIQTKCRICQTKRCKRHDVDSTFILCYLNDITFYQYINVVVVSWDIESRTGPDFSHQIYTQTPEARL